MTLDRFEGLIMLQNLKLVYRVKLYDLLETLISLNNDAINSAIKDRAFANIVIVRFK
jgi:hypothetical protein